MVIAGANVPDFKLLEATLDAIVVERPEPTEEAPQHLCLDKVYDKQPAREVVERHDYQSHIRRIGEEKKELQAKKPVAVVGHTIFIYRRQDVEAAATEGLEPH